MKKAKNITAALQQDRVIDDLIIPFSSEEGEKPLDRLSYLVQAVKGKRVLHLGCCDHIDLIERKITDHTWLHALLAKSAAVCYGIDNNEEAVLYLQNKGWQHIYCADLTVGIPEEVRNEHFDVMILGEILEHLNDPTGFLARLHSFFDYEYTLIITVPNAFFLGNWKNVMNNFERINSDHRYWFTPYTIAKVCYEGGFFPKNINCMFKMPSDGYGNSSQIEKSLYFSYPGFRDELVLEAVSVRPPPTTKRIEQELTQEEISKLFEWDSSPEACDFRSKVKMLFLTMEKDWDLSACDEQTALLLNRIKTLTNENHENIQHISEIKKQTVELQTTVADKEAEKQRNQEQYFRTVQSLTDLLDKSKNTEAQILDELNQKANDIKFFSEELERQGAQVKNLSNKLNEKEKSIQSLSEECKRQGAQIKNLSDELTEKEKTIQSLAEERERQDAQFKNLSDELTEKEKTIQSLSEELEQQAAQVKNLSDEYKLTVAQELAMSDQLKEKTGTILNLYEEQARLTYQQKNLSAELTKITGHAQYLSAELTKEKGNGQYLSAELTKMTGHAQYLSAELTKEKGNGQYLSAELTKMTGHAQYLSAELFKYESKLGGIFSKVRALLKKNLKKGTDCNE